MSPAVRWLGLAILLGLAAVATVVVVVVGDKEANGGTTAGSPRWIALQPSPLERTEVGAARIGRFVYVPGGFLSPEGAATDRVARYDIDNRAWSEVAPMPIAVHHPAAAAGAGRCRGDLYVYGGYAANGPEVDALQRYNPRTDSWTLLPGSGTPRGAATLAPIGCSLYAIGGASGGTSLAVVQVYDIRRGAWRAAAGMRVARDHLASVAIRGRVVVFGGRNAGRNLAATEELDARTGKWRRRPPVPTPRSGFGAAAVRGWAVLAGGEQLAEGSTTIAPVEAFDPRSRRWRKLPGMITPRHGLGVVSRGLRVFAVEGGPRPGLSFSSTLEVLRVPRRVLDRRW